MSSLKTQAEESGFIWISTDRDEFVRCDTQQYLLDEFDFIVKIQRPLLLELLKNMQASQFTDEKQFQFNQTNFKFLLADVLEEIRSTITMIEEL